jgi:hypothetical protein
LVRISNQTDKQVYLILVPPTLDPMRLDIGNLYDWYKNPLPFTVMPLSWYPRNFTNPDINYLDNTQMRISDDALYSVQLGLYVIGYKESDDNKVNFELLDGLSSHILD